MIEKDDYCEFCDGMARLALVSHTFERHGQRFEYKDIPALKCDKCGEVYFDGVALLKIEKEIAEFICSR
jgi:YgiT-type zinc finger domain-containing protein